MGNVSAAAVARSCVLILLVDGERDTQTERRQTEQQRQTNRARHRQIDSWEDTVGEMARQADRQERTTKTETN